eukprot:1038281-Prorocentrum_minimum.AAC.3
MTSSKGAVSYALCLFFLVGNYDGAWGFSTHGGVSCEWASVEHGLDLFQPQEGNGGHGLYIEGSGKTLQEASKNGAAMVVTLHGVEPYKGLLVIATDAEGTKIGEWASDQQSSVVQHLGSVCSDELLLHDDRLGASILRRQVLDVRAL